LSVLCDTISQEKPKEEISHEMAQSTGQATEADTLIHQPITPSSVNHVIKTVPTKRSWNISVAYNGLMGRRDDYLAAATIHNGSSHVIDYDLLPADYSFSNWMDFNFYLNNSPNVRDDEETRSIMNIAAQNSAIDGGWMEARYEHQLPVTLQMLLSRQFTKHLSIETGLSYTQLNSTINTGSHQAFIQEKQRLRYLGIPLRLGWQWYGQAHLSLYSSVGAMLELPIHSTVNIHHIANGVSTFQKESSPDVKNQWSTTVGLGLQYNLTPHLGLYLEPSIQYFFDNGSDLKTYRTEHPLQITLPLGIRFHW
jgi:RNA polymerase sigma-70 factor (ECF subfamily)